jgi:hypothetical protein
LRESLFNAPQTDFLSHLDFGFSGTARLEFRYR